MTHVTIANILNSELTEWKRAEAFDLRAITGTEAIESVISRIADAYVQDDTHFDYLKFIDSATKGD